MEESKTDYFNINVANVFTENPDFQPIRDRVVEYRNEEEGYEIITMEDGSRMIMSWEVDIKIPHNWSTNER
jgi:hypothetical protein